MTNQAVNAFCRTLTLAQAEEWRESDNRAFYICELLEAANISVSSYDASRVEAQFEHLLSQDIERQILEKLVDDALAVGCLVSVHDGEEWPLKRSQDRIDILSATRSTDADTLLFHHADGVAIGEVLLIYGNGYDLISDCTDNAATQALLDGAEALAESFQG